ncbi:MAG: hypothetical protein WC865_03325 [Bacteroidales bacterium]
MQKITSVSELKMAIRQLESDQKKQAELLKTQFNLTAASLNPLNLLMKALKEILSSPVVLFIGIEKIKSYGHRLIDKICARLSIR